MDLPLIGGDARLRKTATAGTLITRVVPPLRRFFTRLLKFAYTNLGTAHTLTVARPIGRAKATADFASGQAVIVLDQEAGAGANVLAANDIVVVRELDGVARNYIVSAVSGLSITMTGNFTAGGKAGADLWNFGILSDTDPKTGEAHQTSALAIDSTTTLEDANAGVARSHAVDEPLFLSINNATTAGVLVLSSYGYTQEG